MRQLIPSCRPIDNDADLETVYEVPSGLRHLRVNFVASLDGVIELRRRSRGLGNADDRAAFMAMRSVADAVLVGAGTVRAERYGPVKLEQSARLRRSKRAQAEVPVLAIVTAHGELDPDAPVFSGPAKPLLITTTWAADHHPELAEYGEPVLCGATDVDLHEAVDKLRSRHLDRILCEGGPMLFHSLLMADLVDELCLSIAPVVAGSDHRRLTGESAVPDVASFQLAGLLEAQSTLLARYIRIRSQ